MKPLRLLLKPLCLQYTFYSVLRVGFEGAHTSLHTREKNYIWNYFCNTCFYFSQLPKTSSDFFRFFRYFRQKLDFTSVPRKTLVCFVWISTTFHVHVTVLVSPMGISQIRNSWENTHNCQKIKLKCFQELRHAVYIKSKHFFLNLKIMA